MIKAVKGPNCLNHQRPLNDVDLGECEQFAFTGDDLAHRVIQRLLIEVRRLNHEIVDPQFMYAGGRIHRHAILCREARIDELRELLIAERDRQSEIVVLPDGATTADDRPADAS